MTDAKHSHFNVIERSGPNVPMLACIFCHHEFDNNEIFIAFHRKGNIIIAVCHWHYKQVEDHAPVENGGWWAMQRHYEHYHFYR